MFLNKYCQDIDIPSVANKVADMVIDFEVNKKISVTNEDDFDVDNEIVTKEEFLRRVDEELDKSNSFDEANRQEDLIDIDDQMSNPEEEDIQIVILSMYS